MAEIKAFSDALTNAIALFSAGGPASEKRNGKSVWVKENGAGFGRKEIEKHFERSAMAAKSFNRQADALFFPALWERLAAADAEAGSDVERATWAFRDALRTAAEAELSAAVPGIPCATALRPRAEARAWRAFRGRLAREKVLKPRKEENDAA